MRRMPEISFEDVWGFIVGQGCVGDLFFLTPWCSRVGEILCRTTTGQFFERASKLPVIRKANHGGNLIKHKIAGFD